LTDRQIVKIDPDRCVEVSRSGSPGWEAGQYLWPTGLTIWDDKSIAVTDAHTGMVSVVDADSLTVSRRFGGNGPGLMGLNMPYGIFADRGSVLLTNTFGAKISEFDRMTGDIKSVWMPRAEWSGDQKRYSEAFLMNERRDYYTRKSTTVSIDGKCYHPDYGALVTCDGSDRLTLRELDGVLLYFVEAAHIDGGVIVLSPQAPTGLFYPDADPKQPKKVRLGGLDRWLVDDRVVGPQGDIDVTASLIP
jgi:hypothetical protein